MERRDKTPAEPADDGEDKDLMRSTLIALGWEESGEDEHVTKPNALEERIKQLEGELATKNEQIAELDAENTFISSTNDELRSRVLELENLSKDNENKSRAGSQEEIQDLLDKISLQERANAVLEEKVKELSLSLASIHESGKEHEMESMASELSQAKQRCGTLESTIEEKEAANALLAKKVDDLSQTISELKKQVVDLIGENTGMSGEINLKLEQLAQKDSILGGKDAKVKELESSLSRAQLTIDELKAQNENLTFQVHDNEALIDNQKKQLLESMSETSEGLSSLQQRIEAQEQKITHMDEQLKQKDAELHAIKDQKDAVTKSHDSMKEKYELIEKDRLLTQAMLDKITREREEYQERCFMQKNIIKKLEMQMEDVKKTDDQKMALTLEIDRISSENKKVSTELDQLRQQNGKLVEENKNLENKLTAMTRDLEMNKGTIDEERARVSLIENELHQLAADKERIKNENAVLTSKVSDLEAELEKATSIDEEIFKEFEEKETFLQGKIDDLEKALGDAIENTMKTSSSDDEIKKMKDQLDVKEKEMEKYKRRITELQDAAKQGNEKDEEIKGLKVNLKEMRRRLSKYEEP